MMKKREFAAMLMLALSMGMTVGCSAKTEPNTMASVEQSTASEKHEEEDKAAEVTEATEATEAPEESEAAEEVLQLEGTMEEIKDFMFVVTESSGASYAFSFEEKPNGLDKVKVGDNVTVSYTGTVSEIDPFVGEVLSVEKK